MEKLYEQIKRYLANNYPHIKLNRVMIACASGLSEYLDAKNEFCTDAYSAKLCLAFEPVGEAGRERLSLCRIFNVKTVYLIVDRNGFICLDEYFTKREFTSSLVVPSLPLKRQRSADDKHRTLCIRAARALHRN